MKSFFPNMAVVGYSRCGAAGLFRKKRFVFLLLTFSLCSLAGSAQLTITGTVRDESGIVLKGVTVNVKNSSITSGTDDEGRYSIACPDLKSTLVFSYIGFARKEVTLDGLSTVVDVLMTRSNQSLNQVVVTGYSSQRKKDITGSVAIVNTQALKSIPSGSAMQALQGQASGVDVINSGLPGASSKILIRGVTSFGNTQPLVLIDGVQGDLNNISADDIESLQVLKDAGAAAIYGVRGSNGVIIVTTKKGRAGAPVFTYDSYYGTRRPLAGNPFNLMNSQDFAKVVNISDPNNSIFKNGMPDYLYRSPSGAGAALEGDPAIDASNYHMDPTNLGKNYLIQKVNKTGTDWFHEIFKPAFEMNQNLTASGGTDKSDYLFSLGYLNQQGTLIGTYLKRYSVRINTNFKLRKGIRVGENVNVFYKDNPSLADQNLFGPIGSAYQIMPVIPVYDIMGNYGGTFAGSGIGSASNPVAMLNRMSNNRYSDMNAVGNAYAEVDFLKNFTARTSIGGNFENVYNQIFSFTEYERAEGNTTPNSYSESSGYNNTLMWTNTVNYSNTFGNHVIKLLVGSESVKYALRNMAGSASNYFSTDYNYLVLNNGTQQVANSSSGSKNTLFSVFGRLDYAYDGKYLLGATVRRDGSSKFGEERQYGIFPSVSLGWRISSERFMKGIDWINDLKLRGSYGVLGSNSNISVSNAYDLYGGGFGDAYYDINGTGNSATQGFYQTRIGNPRTGWEKDIITNVGLDGQLLNNKINFSVEYYKKAINGLLFTQPLPATVGGAAYPVINIGDIQNHGLDISIGYNGNIGRDLQFSVAGNITTYKNQVVRIPDPGYFDAGVQHDFGNTVRNQVGQAVSSFFGYKVIGLFKDSTDVVSSPTQTDAAPGRFKYQDINGDKAITPDDRTFLGSPNPSFTYGINLGINYKGFDLSTILYGSQGSKLVNTVKSSTDFFGLAGEKSNVLLNAWTPQNQNTTVPKIENARTFSTNGVFNSYFVEDGSYLRMRSLILGYSLPTGLVRKTGLNNLRIYLQASNLFTITKYSGLDPEIGGDTQNFGIDYATYPNNEKTFLLGIRLSF